MANNQLLASDNFQRPDGTLTSPWVAARGSLAQIASHVVEPTALSTLGGQVYSGPTWTNDQISEVTIGAFTNEVTTQIQLFVRQQTAADTGYVLVLSGTGLTLYKVASGTPTSIATATGLTISAGDVWALQAAGSCISVWQNQKRIVYVADTAYPSGGSPGFGVYSTVNITHSQVSSWRGYSAIQQDGIWQKQGIIIPASTSDLTVSPATGAWINSAILHEGNAQLLSGTVYKMWFSGGHDICYAESTDGIAWTRKATAVITGYGVPCIYKNGSTYYLYAQPWTGSGAADFACFNSADGVNWGGPVTTTCLGSTGSQYTLQPVTIIGGLWYGLYTSYTTGLNGSINLITSDDGLSWNKYGGNPVAAGYWNSQAIINVGGTWYMWCEVNNPGRGNASAPHLDPTETVRIQSTDLINWTNPVHSVHNTQLFESPNNNTGQCFPAAIIDVGGKAYLYTTSDPSDAISPYVYQIGLAIAQVPTTTIITGKEDAVTQIVSDAFTSGIGPLSSNWATPTGSTALQIVAGPYCEPTATGTDCSAAYTGATFSPDQYSEITIQALGSGQILNPRVRMDTASVSYYGVNLVGPTGSLVSTLYITKTLAGVTTQIGAPTTGLTLQVGDVIRLAVIGNIITVYQNNFVIQQVEDFASSLTTGYPGLGGNTSTLVQAQASLWAGGNANSIYNILGSAGVAGATVSYSGVASGSVIADGSGNYTIPNLANGSYTITPSKTGYTFSPTSASETVSGADITGVNFAASSGPVGTGYSVPDCRKSPYGPNASRNVQGTLIYDVQTSSNPAVPSKDSRAAGALADSRTAPNIPENSRTPGVNGPGN
jgi:hypothetical protein